MSDQINPQVDPNVTTTPAPVSPPPVETTAPVQPPVPAGPSPLMQEASQYGFDPTRYKDESELMRDVLSRLREQQPYVQMAQQQLLQRPEPKPEPEPKEEEWSLDRHFGGRWKAPEFNEEWNRLIQAGIVEADQETGLFKPRQGYELVAAKQAQALNEYQDWKRQAVQEFLFKGNPYQNLWETFQEPLNRVLEERLEKFWGDRFGSYQNEQFLDAFETQNASWMYERDQQGQFRRDGQGKFVPTGDGQRFLQAAQKLAQSGIQDHKRILELAYELAGPKQAPVQAAPPVAPEKKTSFVEDAMAKAQHKPSGGAGTIDVNAPVQVSSQELDTMFSRAAAAAGIK